MLSYTCGWCRWTHAYPWNIDIVVNKCRNKTVQYTMVIFMGTCTWALQTYTPFHVILYMVRKCIHCFCSQWRTFWIAGEKSASMRKNQSSVFIYIYIYVHIYIYYFHQHTAIIWQCCTYNIENGTNRIIKCSIFTSKSKENIRYLNKIVSHQLLYDYIQYKCNHIIITIKTSSQPQQDVITKEPGIRWETYIGSHICGTRRRINILLLWLAKIINFGNFFRLTVCLSVCLPVCLFVCLSVIFTILVAPFKQSTPNLAYICILDLARSV